MSMKQIWNEGRVAGYSAYEIYVKQAKAIGETPVSEREWLASSLSSGSSLLLGLCIGSNTYKFKDPDEVYHINIPLPPSVDGQTRTNLCAANTIVASFFDGDAEFGIDTGNAQAKWATYVKSYGPLLSNTSTSHPSSTVHAINDTLLPVASDIKPSATIQAQLKNYMHIYDGIAMSPGNWTSTGLTEPAMDFAPDFPANTTQFGFIRLAVKGPITNDGVLILLTGFTDAGIVVGTTAPDGTLPDTTNPLEDSESIGTANPENGDFLGPQVYPWANKIIFTTPTAYYNWMDSYTYQRTIHNEYAITPESDTPIIDLKDADFTYYDNYPGSEYSYSVSNHTEFSSANLDTLTVVERAPDLPPALFASTIQATGTNVLYPVDTIAPGTTKIFDYRDEVTVSNGPDEKSEADAESEAETYTSGNQNTVALVRNADLGLFKTPVKHSVDWFPIAETHTNAHKIEVPLSFPVTITGETNKAYYYELYSTTGVTTRHGISLVDQNGNALKLGNESGSPEWDVSAGKLMWRDLLLALGNNVRLDLLGANLRTFQQASMTSNSLTFGNSSTLTFANANNTFTLGNEYIKFPADSILNIRQYSSSTPLYRLASIDYHNENGSSSYKTFSWFTTGCSPYLFSDYRVAFKENQPFTVKSPIDPANISAWTANTAYASGSIVKVTKDNVTTMYKAVVDIAAAQNFSANSGWIVWDKINPDFGEVDTDEIPVYDNTYTYLSGDTITYNFDVDTQTAAYAIYKCIANNTTGKLPVIDDPNNPGTKIVNSTYWDRLLISTGARTRISSNLELYASYGGEYSATMNFGIRPSATYIHKADNKRAYSGSRTNSIFDTYYSKNSENLTNVYGSKYLLQVFNNAYSIRIGLLDYTATESTGALSPWNATPIAPLNIAQGSRILSDGTLISANGYDTDCTYIAKISSDFNILVPYVWLKTKINGNTSTLTFGRWPTTADVTNINNKYDTAWVTNHSYAIGDIVYVGSDHVHKYRCITANTSSNSNKPTVSGGATYWEAWNYMATDIMKPSYTDWDSTVAYNVDDYVYLSNTYYRCKAANTNKQPGTTAGNDYWDVYSTKTACTYYTDMASKQSKWTDGADVANLMNDMSAGFIQLPNYLRLYISTTEPVPGEQGSKIPTGSIGIGW